MHAFVVSVYVFMTCEGIQNFDLFEQNKIIAGMLEEGVGRPPESFASSDLPVTVPALSAQRAALLAWKLSNKWLFLISRSLLLDRAPKRLSLDFPNRLKRKHLGVSWSLFSKY